MGGISKKDLEKKLKYENYINYLLTIGFILGIVIFLVSIVTISRFVFSDSTSIGQHVKETKNLLEDINKVDSITQSNKTEMIKNNFKIDNLYKILIDDKFIDSYSITNINKNSSLIVLKLNENISNYNNIYYIKIKNISNLNERDNIVYLDKLDIPRIGKFLSLEYKNNKIKIVVLDLIDDKIISLNDEKKILGKLIFLKN